MQNIQSLAGVVIIGRNEGSRLVSCLDSLSEFMPQVVYVDSASTDNSLAEAETRGATVVSLDMTQSFTAARARNVGFDTLVSQFPDIKFVQFIDGDCMMNSDWIRTAIDFLHKNSVVAAVCGRRRELFPDRSIYNRMCNQEWDTPIGEAKACGGDVMMRVDVMRQVGGYRNNLIAGEEPELCIRIRKAGYSIWRIDAEMTLHDAAITKFSQWWRRTTRGGYAFAEGAYLHGAAPECHWVAESRRGWFWGFILPFIILLTLFLSWKLSFILFLLYPLQIIRLTFKQNNQTNIYFAFFLVLGKFAEALGQLKFVKKHYLNEKIHLIEYK